MVKCFACGRSIPPGEGLKRIKVGTDTYFICCPMCLTVLEAGQVQWKMLPSSFSDDLVEVLVEYLLALQI